MAKSCPSMLFDVVMEYMVPQIKKWQLKQMRTVLWKTCYGNDIYRGEPLSLKLYLLEGITNNFSEDLIIGQGGYGVVYKPMGKSDKTLSRVNPWLEGVLGDDFVAVKKFYRHHAIEEKPFQREVDCLMRIRHPNIVWFVGYCAETSLKVVQGVENRFVNSTERLLCFEYLRNGSLKKHITGKAPELQWRICYQIIKGICLGLHYLHERQVIHLDLKPDNILLDDDMVPKIADFGVSRLLGERSDIVTKNIIGSRRYMAPEYENGGVITVKSDIYSLGIIIGDMVMRCNTGATTETLSNEKVLESWIRRQKSDPSQLKQIKECINIAEICTELKPEKRPAIGDILRRLEDATTPVVGRRGLLSKLMEDMQRLAVSSSQQPSTRGQGSNASLPAPSSQLVPSHHGPGDTKPDKMSFWLDRASGAKCYMLSSRSLNITWGEKPGYWKWISLPESRFAECAELLSVYFLAVIAEIATEKLSYGMRYAVYLIYKLARSTTTGLKGFQTSSVRLYGERIVATNKVSVDPTARGATGVAFPVTRGDGWMELKLAELAIDEQMLSEKAVLVDFREENVNIKKSGLIIEGIEFRPNN